MAPLSRQEKHRLATKQGMERSAAARQCPACGRKAALKRSVTAGIVVRVCRWCGYEQGGAYVGPDVEERPNERP